MIRWAKATAAATLILAGLVLIPSTSWAQPSIDLDPAHHTSDLSDPDPAHHQPVVTCGAGASSCVATPISGFDIHGNRLAAPATQQSAVWAGFQAQPVAGNGYQSVGAQWYQPTVDCKDSPPNSHVSIWAGIGGQGNTPLVQAGIDTGCSGGKATYKAFYEYYDHGAPEIAFTDAHNKPLQVAAGDLIFVDVEASSSSRDATWTMRMYAQGPLGGFNHYSKPIAVHDSPINGTAQCVAERPITKAGPVPLAKFSTFAFSICDAGFANKVSGDAYGLYIPMNLLTGQQGNGLGPSPASIDQLEMYQIAGSPGHQHFTGKQLAVAANTGKYGNPTIQWVGAD